jgi:NAD+ diphosphatase
MPLTNIYQRYQPSVIPQREYAQPACWFIFKSGQLLVQENAESVSLPISRTAEELGIYPLRMQYLGTLENRPCYSAEVAPEATEPSGMIFRGLRSLHGAIDEDIFYLAGRAFQIVNWDRNHQYCGSCGKPTISLERERAKLCQACGLTSYPRLSPAVITAILKPGQILLAHAPNFSEKMYSLIAGFVEPGESLEECVQREIMEEVGIKIKNIRYFGSQPWPFPDSLMIGFIADYDCGDIVVDGVELTDAAWFEIGNLPELPSSISIARKIIDWVVSEQFTSR